MLPPDDVLVRIFDTLEDIRDFLALSSTCRLLRAISTSTARLRYVKESLSYGKIPVHTGSPGLSGHDALSRLQKHERAWKNPDQAVRHKLFLHTSRNESALVGEYFYSGRWDATGTEFVIDRLHLAEDHIDIAWFKRRAGAGAERRSGHFLCPQFIINEYQDVLIYIAVKMVPCTHVSFCVYSLSTLEPHPKEGSCIMGSCTVHETPLAISLCDREIAVLHVGHEAVTRRVTVVDWQTGQVVSVTSDFGKSLQLGVMQHVSSGVLITGTLAPYSHSPSVVTLVYLSRNAVVSFALPPLHKFLSNSGISLSRISRSMALGNYSTDPRIIDDRIIALWIKTQHPDLTRHPDGDSNEALFVIDRRELLQYLTEGCNGLIVQDSPIPFEEWGARVQTRVVLLSLDISTFGLFITIGMRLIIMAHERKHDAFLEVYDFSPYHGSALSTAVVTNSDNLVPLDPHWHPHFAQVSGKKLLPCRRYRSTILFSDPEDVGHESGSFVHINERQILYSKPVDEGLGWVQAIQVTRFY